MNIPKYFLSMIGDEDNFPITEARVITNNIKNYTCLFVFAWGCYVSFFVGQKVNSNAKHTSKLDICKRDIKTK